MPSNRLQFCAYRFLRTIHDNVSIYFNAIKLSQLKERRAVFCELIGSNLVHIKLQVGGELYLCFSLCVEWVG